jgi:hypothetical protein
MIWTFSGLMRSLYLSSQLTKRCTGVAAGGFSVFRTSTGRNPVNAVVMWKRIGVSVMNVEHLLSDSAWQMCFQIDDNERGPGRYIRLLGNSTSFRRFATLMMAMADNVDDASHPASTAGWSISLTNEMPQVRIENAAVVSLNCHPVTE